MKKLAFYFLGFILLFLFSECKDKSAAQVEQSTQQPLITYAKGFTLKAYDGIYVVQITQPWASAKERFTYVLKREQAKVPDSLQQYTQIQIPIKTIACTSTTHIPAISTLDEVQTLIGFAGLDYISTASVRQEIDRGHIRELGQNEALNVEAIVDIAPDVFMAFAMDNGNKALHTIEQAGIPVLYNGDWTEQHPLGKAEWIKLFGVLFDKEKEANQFFEDIVIAYKGALQLVEKAKNQPTVVSGVMYSDVWYLPEGNSWAAVYFKDAKANYLWQNTSGVGSLALSFEQVLERGQQAEFWINPGHYESLSDLAAANPHYKEFDAFKNGKVYSFAPTKGQTGGTLFYEWGPLRPDWVVKDLIQILHPELLPDYQPFFYRQLQ
ncbi:MULTISPECIES: ABC transporter substrate-binding protein [Myroides]|uniref:ABC transporter substrate-binding protein n=1 Tax=Myroides odoratus TaxID=256 RepID=UPI0024C05951|nr:ABC transporter substrate-binding protein [Myroides sp. mNGS23_01]WHT40158.1 ABC transporter substrate-binding protein [Myroides sp. mNGS23_01]